MLQIIASIFVDPIGLIFFESDIAIRPEIFRLKWTFVLVDIKSPDLSHRDALQNFIAQMEQLVGKLVALVRVVRKTFNIIKKTVYAKLQMLKLAVKVHYSH